MKFTVEVEEFWLEGEELSESLVNVVKGSVSRQIKDLMEERITKLVKEEIGRHLETSIKDRIADFMANETLIIQGQEVAVKDHLRSLFKQNRGWNSVLEQIQKYSEKFSKEMKRQYDAAFANQIVVALKNQGMLKDEVVNILLEGKE